MRAIIDRFRLWKRERRRWRKQARMFRDTDVLIVCHTKSGQTWLRVMLSHLLHGKYGVPVDELIRFDNFQTYNTAIPKIHFVRDTRLEAARHGAEDVAVANRQKVVFLVRDPRDVAISFHFHIVHRASASELIHKEIPETIRKMPISDFVVDPRYGVPRIIEYYNQWLREAPAFSQVCFLRYEDMHRQAEVELARLSRFLELDVDEAGVGAAVRFASFESLQQKEREGFFRSSRLGAVDPGNQESMKVRRGEIGGYRQHVTPEQAAVLDAMVGSSLHPDYGYGADGVRDAHLSSAAH
jgi:hypothetical protein